jgi:hypothetical protein
MNRILALLVLLILIGTAPLARGDECKGTFMRAGKTGDFSEAAHKALDEQYHVVDVDPKKRPFEEPKAISGEVPSTPLDDGGNEMRGHVAIAYVVNLDGKLEGLTVIDSNSDELAKLSLGAMNDWHFTPGKVDKAPACVAAVHAFRY